MAADSLTQQIRRIYAAIDALQELDLTELPAKIIKGPQDIEVIQDFMGDLNQETLANKAYSAIHNIAKLQDHLRRWAARNGHDKSRVDTAVRDSRWLKIIKDLWNNDKHGYPPRDGGDSGVAPKVAELRREMQLTIGAEPDSRVIMTLDSRGVPNVSGTGMARAVITGDVVDRDGNVLGDLYEIELKAVEAWQTLLEAFGLDIVSNADA